MNRTVIKCILLMSTMLFYHTAPTNAGPVEPHTNEAVTISGQVTDFDGRPLEECVVKILRRDFTTVTQTYTDEQGRYALDLEKGRYMAMYVIRPDEYPRMNAVLPEDMRLEFWAWNIVADRDITINPRYHRLELYGTTVFEVFGGYPGLFVYFRPMSLTKSLSYPPDIYLDKALAEEIINVSVEPQHLELKIYADEELLKINTIQPIEEFTGEGKKTITGYIAQVDPPTAIPNKPYIIFRVEAENLEHNEKGENIYFYELPKFN